jgi:hypothetical protein
MSVSRVNMSVSMFQIISNAKLCFIWIRLYIELDIAFFHLLLILLLNSQKWKIDIPSSFEVDSWWITANPSLFNHLRFKKKVNVWPRRLDPCSLIFPIDIEGSQPDFIMKLSPNSTVSINISTNSTNVWHWNLRPLV